MTNKKTSIGILGGGISGLTAAYELQKRGFSVTVYEQSDRPGGAIGSVTTNDWLVEEGPNTLQVKTQEVWDLISNLGLESDLLEAAPQAKKRYVVKDKQPVALPGSLGQFLSTPLLSAAGKLRLLKEPFVSTSGQKDESIASFTIRRLGRQPLDYAINPFVSGIFAGDPKQLSVKHTFSALWEMEQQEGSLVKGMAKKIKSRNNSSSVKRALVSFTMGNRQLPDTLAKELGKAIHLNTTVTSAIQEGNHWQVEIIKNGDRLTALHDSIISTIPVFKISELLSDPLLSELEEVPYTPLSVLALGFHRSQVEHSLDGFGLLVPEVEKLNTLGMLFSSTLFPERAPKDHCLLTCFVGGARQPEAASLPKEQLVKNVLKDLNLVLGIHGDPVFSHHRYWRKAIPQYKVGYDRYLQLMNQIEEQYEGLFLTGNYRGGVSVPDCIHGGIETAASVEQYLNKHIGRKRL